MSVVDDLLTDARILVLQPGDLVVLESPQPMNRAQAEEAKTRLKSHPALADHDILVLGAGNRLAAVRPAS